MNYVDLSILLILAIFIGIGIWRGFLNEILTFLGFVVAFLIAFLLYSFLGQYIYHELNIPPGMANLISFMAIFLLLQITWSFSSTFIYGKVYQKWENVPRFQTMEKTLGAGAGLLNGFVIITLLLLILVIVPIQPKVKAYFSDAKIATFFIGNASILNDKIEKLFVPAANEAEAKIRNLTASVLPGEEDDVSFPEDLNLTVDAQAELRMFELINAERIRRRLNPLVLDSELTEVARAHSGEMFELSYFDHQSPVTGTPFDRLNAAEIIYKMAGENLAYAPNVDVAHWGLMDSPSHKENILGADFQKIGIGIISAGAWGEMFTQEFTD